MKKYIFRLDKFIEDCLREGDSQADIEEYIDNWARRVDGAEVTFNSSSYDYGVCELCMISREWCEEIEIGDEI